MCASRRATQLAQALQDKFGSLTPTGEDPMSNDQHRRRQFIEGLRAVAQFYEENPGAWYDGMHLTLNMYVWGRAARKTLSETARALATVTRSMTTTTLPSPGSSASR